MKIGDLIRYNAPSSRLHNMLGIIADISKANEMHHALVVFKNGEKHWTNLIALEVV